MRRNVQHATSEHIIGEAAVRSFFYSCMFNLKLGAGFHPDTDFSDYIYKEGNKKSKPCFTKEEAEELNNTLDECFKQCEKEGLDIYAIALEVAEPILKEMFGK